MYPEERIQTALENFFQLTHLNQLRELAMKEIAHRLGQRCAIRTSARLRTRTRNAWPWPSARAARIRHVLLRKTSRLADRFNAPWYAIYVQTPQETIQHTGAATHRQLTKTLTLAHQLGGIVLEFKGDDVPSTIGAFVQEYGISHLLVGRTQRPWYRRWFGQTTLDQLLRTLHNVDVIVVDNAGS